MLSFKMIFSEKKKSQKPEVEFRVYFFAKVKKRRNYFPAGIRWRAFRVVRFC